MSSRTTSASSTSSPRRWGCPASSSAQRGATVEYLTCYHRGGPADDPAPLVARARDGRLDALTLTSSEGVAHLAALPGAADLRPVPVFVPHPRIA
ncbi:MAG TPA: uroporphyrinogen-III synthase, partial [Myxococcota bacterium]|nr:uroporphyrinogen-III synthase [Myxococcota bacterium]